MDILHAIILAIVEGITEFLPISSTGHMIIASSIMGIEEDSFTKFFEICIQLGAILSVVVLYWKKFVNFKEISFYIKLFVSFIPAAICGVLFSDQIDALLESPLTVGIMLFIGGVFLLFVDKIFNQAKIIEEKDIQYKNAFVIGCFQVLAMIPGVSRSAATIVGGMQQKLSRSLAAEYSFFLAVPTMFAATAKKSLDYYQAGISITQQQWIILAIGNIVAFIVAMLAIKFFIAYLQKNGFKLFGYYRIIIGLIIIAILVLQ
ncbi:MAG: undecaprenyl-diphosphate phosphatase [Chitinophagales bacterium]|nr:undecaprenyl-diphosphate phosphatase [Chitinophagales bacterium]